MDGETLKALVPDLMAAHADVTWAFIETAESFAIEIRPMADPERFARVHVSESTEIFGYTFAGHETMDFAYELPDKKELLQEQIDVAVAALKGPTQVLLEWAGDRMIGSGITQNPDGEAPDAVTTGWSVVKLAWWIRGKRVRREVLRFPKLP